ncbi:helix-turn-helix domain-containing protein [Peribacillus butanolivorans]
MISLEEIDEFVREAENSKSVLVFCDGLPIGRQIRIKRAHDSLSLIALSDAIGVPKTTLSEIECGRRVIPRKHQAAIEDYLYHQYWAEGEFLERWEQ